MILQKQAIAQYTQGYPNPYHIQYHTYHWRVLHTPYFHVYYPAGYDSLCSHICEQYPLASAQIQKRMSTTASGIPQIVVYPAIDQLYETNIGSTVPDQYTFPTFVTKGHRILLAYTGDYEVLTAQLYEALARAAWENAFPANLEAQASGIIPNDKIPLWYKEGCIRYFAHGWRIADEDAVRLSLEGNAYDSWQAYLAAYPRLGGQAFCYFLSRKYYPQAPLQLFNQLKKKKDIARAARLIVKKPLDSLYAECLQFYQARTIPNPNIDTTRNITQFAILHKKGIIRQVLLSPDGHHIAYTVSTFPYRTVYAYDKRSGKTVKITGYQLPPWISDPAADPYPLLQWTDNSLLLITIPNKGKLTIRAYAANGTLSNTYRLPGIDGITGATLQGKSRQIGLAAFYRGQSDIVQYDPNRERYQPLTNDAYDDAQPVWNQDGSLQYFVSGRHEQPYKKGDTLPVKQGIYTLQANSSIPVLTTDTGSFIRYQHPVRLPSGNLLLTHTRNGQQRYALITNENQPTQVQTLTPYRPLQYLPQQQSISSYRYSKDSLYIIQQPIVNWLDNSQTNDTTSPWLQDYRDMQAQQAKDDSILNAARRNNQAGFLEGVLVPANAKSKTQNRRDSIAELMRYDPKKIQPYILQLHSAYFSAKVNNDYFINRYQPYLNYQGQFKFPQVGGMVQGGFSDVLENHHLNIAFKIPAATEGSDFFVKYRNTKKRLDWGLTYFRKVEQLQPNPLRNWVNENGQTYPNAAKVKTHYYELELEYPLGYDMAVGFTEAIRYDRTIFQATDKYSLPFPDIKSIWSISSLSGTLNRLQPTVPQLYKGFFAKLNVDIFKGFSQSEPALTGLTAHIEYHQPLYKYITLVAQASAGYSGGDQRVLYNLAGVDNNLTVRTNSNVHFNQTAPYAFQTLVTPLRGFLQNTLYGDRYALLNADVYFPLFKTLMPIETPLSSINNLQLGLFTDAATAGEYWSNPAIKKGWVQSYGFSARTMLAGYPIRFDMAWPGSFDKRPVYYISLRVR